MSDLTTPSELGTGGRTADEALAQELVERARSEGVELVGPDGLLTDLTKTVLETALEVELGETRRHLPRMLHLACGLISWRAADWTPLPE
jgi:hypothetical protein